MKMCLATRAVVVVLVAVLLADHRAEGLPYRRKRTSDHRLAELEAYVGLSRMKGQLITVPIGFGRVNLNDVGRRRRSAQPYALQDVVDSARTQQDGSDESLDDLLGNIEKARPYQWDAY